MAPIPGENVHFTFANSTASMDRLRMSADEQDMEEVMVKDVNDELLSVFKLSSELRRYMFNAGLVTPDGLIDPNTEEIYLLMMMNMKR